MKPDRLSLPHAVSRLVSEPQGVENRSGLEPVGTKVLILTDQIADVTKGNIQLPPGYVEEKNLAVTRGTLVAIGGAGFTDWPNSDRKWPGAVPAIGQRVCLAKYAGIVVDGKDGKTYRLCQDTEITGVEQ